MKRKSKQKHTAVFERRKKILGSRWGKIFDYSLLPQEEKEKMKQKMNDWVKKNRKRMNKTQREYAKRRRLTDKTFREKARIRSKIAYYKKRLKQLEGVEK